VLNLLRTGVLDTVQVIYNIFEHAPSDALLPACEEYGVGVVERVGCVAKPLKKNAPMAHQDFRASIRKVREFVTSEVKAGVPGRCAIRWVGRGRVSSVRRASR
jgi:aryl-alcohol dehydrogenase-like predicted oxidoreductase